MDSHKEKYIELAESARRIVITSHLRPDADAISSSLGMYYWTKKYLPEKETHVLFLKPQDFSYQDYFLYDRIEWVDEYEDHINEGDFLVFLDGNSLQRFSNHPEKIDLSKYKSFCLDHHYLDFEGYDHMAVYPNASSACDLLVKYFYSDDDLKDKDVAGLLMRGIIRDSGSFTYVTSQQSDVFLQVKRVLDNSQINLKAIVDKLNQMKQDEFLALRLLTVNSELHTDDVTVPGFITTYLNEEDFKKFDPISVKNAYHIFMGKFYCLIEGCPWGFVVVQEKDKFKISLRSTYGGPDVAKLSEAHFKGSGYSMTAGGSLPLVFALSAEDAKNKMVEIINKTKLELIALK